MKRLNLGTRVEMFAICTSIEYDLKDFINKNNSKILFSHDMMGKAKERDKTVITDEEILDQLDLKDYIDLIKANPYMYAINNDKCKELESYFRTIIPVRNRVMHTKPLELGDRALLIEVMDGIGNHLPWIEWLELMKTKKILETDPSKLLSQRYIGIKEYNPSIYHNLPEPEFDDTGYIGRKRDIQEIRELILNKKNQIITIVGNGGIGKTAIIVKTLYELMEDPNCDYDAIIWITLKTKTLASGEFVEIKDCISSIPDMYNYGQTVIITDSTDASMESILTFMDDFKVLLVLDNLETINTDEINEFIRSIPEQSKVLITSRHGLGEFEIRKKLDGLEKNDAITYFRELSKYYGLTLHMRSNDEIHDIVSKELFSNPLSIKWFISGIFAGTDEKAMLSNKENMINFCISNVFEKLSDNAKKILQIFLLEEQKLTFGIIDFYMKIENSLLEEAINELLTTYMIRAASGEYVMNEMSREYISLNYPPSNNLIMDIFSKRKTLKSMIQRVKVYSEQALFNPNSISSNLSHMDKQLATYYLLQALENGKQKLWENANLFIEKAGNIAPNYFEVYKVKAFIDAERGELYGAINNYKIALTKCETDKERAIVSYLFSVFFTIKMQDFDSAKEYIDKADLFLPDTNEILLEKVRVYMCLGKYNDAESLWNIVNESEKYPSLRTANIMASRFAELKRRQAETYENRDYKIKYQLLKISIEKINTVEKIDYKTAIVLIRILEDLSYLYYYDDAMELLLDAIKKYFIYISRINHTDKKKMQDKLIGHKEEIREDIYNELIKYIYDYKFLSTTIDKEDEGIVIALKDYYGFISNHHYYTSNSLFFSLSNAYEDIQVGDYVSFNIYEGKKGKAAKNIKKIDV